MSSKIQCALLEACRAASGSTVCSGTLVYRMSLITPGGSGLSCGLL